VKDYGADVVRLWVASQDYRNDIVVSEERLKKVGETYRLLRNTLRFQLGNLFDFDPARDGVPTAELEGLDRWVLGEFAALESAVAKAYEDFEFHVVYQRLSQFASVELSAIYHDVVKDRLYSEAAGSRRRRSAQTALWNLASGLARMLSPILAFTADESWEHLPAHGHDSVHLAIWNPSVDPRDEEEKAAWAKLMWIRSQSLPELEKARQAKRIGKALEARLALSLGPDDLAVASERLGEINELLSVSGSVVSGGAQFAVTVERAEGSKCGRCWRWDTGVGLSHSHPTLCPRCVAAVPDHGNMAGT
jgi:isoleucyl-tRNA synthetase